MWSPSVQWRTLHGGSKPSLLSAVLGELQTQRSPLPHGGASPDPVEVRVAQRVRPAVLEHRARRAESFGGPSCATSTRKEIGGTTPSTGRSTHPLRTDGEGVNGRNLRRLGAHQPGDKAAGQRLKHASDSTIGGFQINGFRFLDSPGASAPRHPAVVRMPSRAAVERPRVKAGPAEEGNRWRRRPSRPRYGPSLAPLGPRDHPEGAEKEEPDHEQPAGELGRVIPRKVHENLDVWNLS